ncbi:RNA polymerase sigma factor [Galbibacter sp. EGI 63066]|nr:RNA polymerase sigma factor [Galbibacter sp. EGI 63066]
MTANNDQHLIDQVISGDTAVFSVLVTRYKDLVFTLTLRMLKNKEEAEEVAQDTFIKAYKSLQKFKGDSKFSTWLYKIAYHNCLDRLKLYKKERALVSMETITEPNIKITDNAFEQLARAEKRQTILECMETLPTKDSFLLTLYYFEEQSLEEISHIIGIKPNNVKVKLFRSRKKLAAVLRQKLEPEIIESYERAGRKTS